MVHNGSGVSTYPPNSDDYEYIEDFEEAFKEWKEEYPSEYKRWLKYNEEI